MVQEIAAGGRTDYVLLNARIDLPSGAILVLSQSVAHPLAPAPGSLPPNPSAPPQSPMRRGHIELRGLAPWGSSRGAAWCFALACFRHVCPPLLVCLLTLAWSISILTPRRLRPASQSCCPRTWHGSMAAGAPSHDRSRDR